MKIYSVILALFFTLSISLNSQVIKNYGVKIGLTSSNITRSNYKPVEFDGILYNLSFNNGQLISPTFSLWARILESKYVNLEVESSYIIKGLSYSRDINFNTTSDPNDNGEKQNVTTSWSVKYLQLFFNSQFKLKVVNITAYAILGPTLSYMLVSENFVTFDDNTNDFIIGYNLGVGVNLNNLIDNNIFIETRYNGDFTEFYNNNADYWNKVWIFNIGVQL